MYPFSNLKKKVVCLKKGSRNTTKTHNSKVEMKNIRKTPIPSKVSCL